MDPDIAMTPIILDLETAGLPNAADYLEPVQAARNLRDAEKIKADIAQRTAERDSKIGLDPNVGRIVALGWWTQESGQEIWVCSSEFEESEAIRAFWKAAKHRPIIGFNVKAFDLRFLIQRSRYLQIPYPWVDLNKYASKGVIDLYLELTFFDSYSEGAMKRSLKAFCKRFGIEVDDPIDGADIADLVLLGEWGKVESHCAADIERTRRLAERLGYVRPVVAQPDPTGALVSF